MKQVFFNNLSLRTAAPVYTNTNTLILNGSLPLAENEWCYLTIGAQEIVIAQKIGGNVVINRSQQGTVAPPIWATGTLVEQHVTAADLALMNADLIALRAFYADNADMLNIINNAIGNVKITIDAASAAGIGSFELFSEGNAPAGFALPGAKLPVSDYANLPAFANFDLSAPSLLEQSITMAADFQQVTKQYTPIPAVSDDGNCLLILACNYATTAKSAYSVDGGATWKYIILTITQGSTLNNQTPILIKAGDYLDVYYIAPAGTNQSAIFKLRINHVTNAVVSTTEVHRNPNNNGYSSSYYGGMFKVGSAYMWAALVSYTFTTYATMVFKVASTTDNFTTVNYTTATFTVNTEGYQTYSPTIAFATNPSNSVVYMLLFDKSVSTTNGFINIYSSVDNGKNWIFLKKHTPFTAYPTTSDYYVFKNGFAAGATQHGIFNAVVNDDLLSLLYTDSSGNSRLGYIPLDASVTTGVQLFKTNDRPFSTKYSKSMPIPQGVFNKIDNRLLLRSASGFIAPVQANNSSAVFLSYDNATNTAVISRMIDDFGQYYQVPYLTPPSGGVYAMRVV